MNTEICPICGLEASIRGADALYVVCDRCGNFQIGGTARSIIQTTRTQGFRPESEHHRDWLLLQFLPAHTRQQSDAGEKVTLNSTNWRDYARKHTNTPEEQKLYILLCLIKDRTQIPGYGALLDCNLDYPLVDAASLNECKDLLDDLKKQNLVEYIWETRASYEVTIISAGRRYLEEKSSQVIGEMDFEAVAVAAQYEYISQSRLAELKALQPAAYDLRRLIRLCEEIDISFRNECWSAVIALTRALIDHVPPIFGQGTFEQVANNYSGTKSFKDSMRHLQGSSRSIANAHLHTPIRKSESLPVATQVNFANDLDVLLGEIVRILGQ